MRYGETDSLGVMMYEQKRIKVRDFGMNVNVVALHHTHANECTDSVWLQVSSVFGGCTRMAPSFWLYDVRASV